VHYSGYSITALCPGGTWGGNCKPLNLSSESATCPKLGGTGAEAPPLPFLIPFVVKISFSSWAVSHRLRQVGKETKKKAFIQDPPAWSFYFKIGEFRFSKVYYFSTRRLVAAVAVWTPVIHHWGDWKLYQDTFLFSKINFPFMPSGESTRLP